MNIADLSESDLALLRGPRGQRGKPGKDFNFEEHREFFEGLKLKFSDLSPQEVDSLKLKFKDLSKEEIDSIKLKFTDLSDEERLSLRGPRGQRGRVGAMGEMGPRGPQGEIGPTGPQCLPGKNGQDGLDGKDAPIIEEIRVEQYSDSEIALRFDFSDGTSIESNRVALASGKGTSQTATQLISVPSSGIVLENIECDPSVFVGSAVRLDGSVAVNALADSLLNSNVLGLVEYKASSTLCSVRISGVSGSFYSGLDVTKEYYLSDTLAGTVVPSESAPTAIGAVRVRVGQPLNLTQMIYSRGGRQVNSSPIVEGAIIDLSNGGDIAIDTGTRTDGSSVIDQGDRVI